MEFIKSLSSPDKNSINKITKNDSNNLSKNKQNNLKKNTNSEKKDDSKVKSKVENNKNIKQDSKPKEINYVEPLFSLICCDKKKILAVSNQDSTYENINKNDIIILKNKEYFDRTFKAKITSINIYDNYDDLYQSEDFDKIYPTFSNLTRDNQLKLFNKFHPVKSKTQDPKKSISKVKAIRFIKIKD